MRILITGGAIPAKLDSVKYITNRFKGGLAVKTAKALEALGHEVTFLCWKYSGIDANFSCPVIRIEDINDYREKVLSFEADAYILAAAVANLMPSTPYEKKFPSHLYSVGEKFDIEFEISPRVIDEIKKIRPRATLIGYKLLDGSDEELISASRKILHESKANLIFANNPATAKNRKLAVTQDGSCFEVTFDEHIKLIHNLIGYKWYTTTVDTSLEFPKLTEEDMWVIENYPKTNIDNLIFGTFAVKKDEGFITTTRGKTGNGLCFVKEVDHQSMKITANNKATLNTPLLDEIFVQSIKKRNPLKYLFHGHDYKFKDIPTLYDYYFPGTKDDLIHAYYGLYLKDDFMVNLKYHGYIYGTNSIVLAQLHFHTKYSSQNTRKV